MRLSHISCSICAHEGWSSPSGLPEPESPAEGGVSPPRMPPLGEGQASAGVSPLRMPLRRPVAALNPLRMPLPGKGRASKSGAANAADEWAFSAGETLGEMLAGENGCDVSSESGVVGTSDHPLCGDPYACWGALTGGSKKAEAPESGRLFILYGDCGRGPRSKSPPPVPGPELGLRGRGGAGSYDVESNPPLKIERLGGSPLRG
jgi:hypothetical protein